MPFWHKTAEHPLVTCWATQASTEIIEKETVHRTYKRELQQESVHIDLERKCNGMAKCVTLSRCLSRMGLDARARVHAVNLGQNGRLLGVQILVRCFKLLPHLRKIELPNCGLDDAAVMLIAAAIPHIASLESLNMSQNGKMSIADEVIRDVEGLESASKKKTEVKFEGDLGLIVSDASSDTKFGFKPSKTGESISGKSITSRDLKGGMLTSCGGAETIVRAAAAHPGNPDGEFELSLEGIALLRESGQRLMKLWKDSGKDPECLSIDSVDLSYDFEDLIPEASASKGLGTTGSDDGSKKALALEEKQDEVEYDALDMEPTPGLSYGDRSDWRATPSEL